MNVLTLATLSAFWAQYPDAEEPIRAWVKHVRSRDYATFADVKADFGSADWVKGYIVFNIGGNKYRLIVTVNFTYRSFFVKHVLTHEDYDDWRPE